jgi:hypothetical protein
MIAIVISTDARRLSGWAWFASTSGTRSKVFRHRLESSYMRGKVLSCGRSSQESEEDDVSASDAVGHVQTARVELGYLFPVHCY